MAQRQGKNLYLWSVTRGISEYPLAGTEIALDPLQALDHIAKSGDKAIFVLKDFHPNLNDAKIVRRLRDLVNELKSSYKTVILLSPVLTIPIEIEKDISVIDYELPDFEEMANLVDDALSQAKGKVSFDFNADDREKIIQAALGMTLSEAENAIARSIVGGSSFTVEEIEETLLKETQQIIRKSRQLEYFEAKESFSEIGGIDTLKQWLVKRGNGFSEKARNFGLPEPKGILLMGVQGCGKSLTCKAISGLWKLPLLRLDMGSIFGQYIGQSEENMRKAIKTAESVAPCVLWLDEIEKGLSGSQSSGSVDAGTTSRIFSTFLTWLQEKRKPVFVAATANNIHQLPPELLRKGRLDEIFFIDLPTEKERLDILSIHIKRKKRIPSSFNIATLAQRTKGFSGAELEQVIVEALHTAFFQNRELNQEDIEEAIECTVPLSTTMAEGIDEIRQWAKIRARPASSNMY